MDEYELQALTLAFLSDEDDNSDDDNEQENDD